MKREEIALLARDVVGNFAGDHYWIFEGAAIEDVAAVIRAAVNAALEEVALEIEKLESGTYTTAQTPAGLVRAHKVE